MIRLVGTLVLPLVAATPLLSQAEREPPVTLTFLDAELSSPEVALRADADLEEFTRQTGIRVKRIPGPEGSQNQLALWRESLRSATGAADVYSIDVIWPRMLAEYLMDLRPHVPEIASYDPTAIAAFTVEGRVVAIPYRPQVGVLRYRSDLLARYGYERPPRTWAELETMAARIQEGERARGEQDFWGFVWQGAASEALTCNALEWQAAEGGGKIIEDDWRVSVNNPQAILAWQRAARWVGSISPPGVVAHQENDSHHLWLARKAAFYRGWQSSYFLRRISQEWAGVTRLPAGRWPGAGTLGGFGLGVARTSAHPHESVELIRFLLRRELEASRAPRPSPGPELLDLPSILMPSPRAAGWRAGSGDVVARPSIVAGPNYESVSRAFFRAVHAVLKGETSAAAAASALEKELVVITGFEKGRPQARPPQ